MTHWVKKLSLPISTARGTYSVRKWSGKDSQRGISSSSTRRIIKESLVPGRTSSIFSQTLIRFGSSMEQWARLTETFSPTSISIKLGWQGYSSEVFQTWRRMFLGFASQMQQLSWTFKHTRTTNREIMTLGMLGDGFQKMGLGKCTTSQWMIAEWVLMSKIFTLLLRNYTSYRTSRSTKSMFIVPQVSVDQSPS